jgi:uncharacterized protein (DUF2252 family)
MVTSDTTIDLNADAASERPRVVAQRRGRPIPPIVHRTPAEHAAAGEEARRKVPHELHAGFEAPKSRRDPIALLQSQAGSRVQELVPIRYGRMLVSPFSFYRGAALVMAHDLAASPTSGLVTQVCGDAHLSNFGFFGSPERRLVFDINDFDETCPGPWEWDLKRLTASFAVAGREIGLTTKQRRTVLRGVAQRYREAMARFAAMRDLDVWYAHLDVDSVLAEFSQQLRPATRKRLSKNLAKTRTRDSMQAFNKLTHLVDGQRRILSDPPLLVTADELLPGVERDSVTEWLRDLVRQYRRTLQSDRRRLVERYECVDIARKVVGVGSVGTRCWILLMLGRDDGDPLFLQAKEAGPSVLTEVGCKSEYTNEGQRVVAGQRFMQASSDIFLGWQRVHGLDGVERDFYIRQLRDWKGSAQLENADYESLLRYGEVCAETLARAHARSGDRIAIAAYLGDTTGFDKAMAEFAEGYADQNERDYKALVEAVDAGRVTAEKGL